MRNRVMMFLNPTAASAADRYNVEQAMISIGSGGWLGRGLFRGSQSQLHFLRVRHTDFIFSVTAEELGFIGAVLLIVLMAFLLLRLLRIASIARDTYRPVDRGRRDDHDPVPDGRQHRHEPEPDAGDRSPAPVHLATAAARCGPC